MGTDECFIENFYEAATDAEEDKHSVYKVSSDIDEKDDAETSSGVGDFFVFFCWHAAGPSHFCQGARGPKYCACSHSDQNLKNMHVVSIQCQNIFIQDT